MMGAGAELPDSVTAPEKHTCPSLDSASQWDEPEALRGEIYVADQLISHAIELARRHGDPSTSVVSGRLWPRFLAVRDQIHDAYRVLTARVRENRDPSPAEEWLLENSHVVEDQIREIDEDLPRGYLLELRRLSQGKMRGYPRVYAICLDYLRHTDARVDLSTLSDYVLAYQREQPLMIGELWAIPIMLRLGLLLTVGALAASEANAGTRERADMWSQRLLAARHSTRALRAELAELERGQPANRAAFIVHLERRLREHDDPALGLVTDWVVSQSARLGSTLEELIRGQHLKQAADQVSVGNAVTSMRSVAAFDWNDFFERTSQVEDLLRQDPIGAYERTNARTRDRYRHAVEGIARRAKATETGVATAALDLARAAQLTSPENSKAAHVGHYLVGDGRPQLEARVHYRPGIRARLLAWMERHPLLNYFASIGLFTAGALVLVGWFGGGGAWTLVAALMALALLPVSEIGLSLTQAWLTAVLRPRLLPRLELKDGIPDECRTLVVIPCLLDSAATLEQLLEDLEVRSLANEEENLHFALLSDFSDSEAIEGPADTELLGLAIAGIQALNDRYRRQPHRYWLLHRRRRFSASEARFMGWERKRGKLEELNRLLRGAMDTSFSCVIAPSELLTKIRYVITLDADTELPRDTARELIATLAHPLNHAEYDAARRRVVRGYGIAQPRVGVLPMSSRRSLYAAAAAGPSGIDPYTTAVSDVYQDLFGEGSYTGKGIYDVDAFSKALEGRVPEAALLSHDLFESFYARCALVSDIELLDEQPAAYEVHAGRQHRWIRGDWQLLSWLFPRVPGPGGERRSNDLRALDRWKLFDNLRRSLVPISMVALSVYGWLRGGSAAATAALVLTGLLAAPVVARVVLSVARKPGRSTSRFLGLGSELVRDGANVAITLTLLLDQALLALDAIVLALYRSFWSQRLVLEWTAMRQAAAAARAELPSRRMLVGGALAVVTLGAVGVFQAGSLPLAAPVLIFWASAPLVAQWLSRPVPVKRPSEELKASDKRLLRLLARRTWRFFDHLVVKEDNYLPPDNFQEEPRGVVAHRTSPTNIGLYLLSTLAAHDLGFIPLGTMLGRISNTLDTLDKLPRREGHLLNWYDTQTLRPLQPEYVSTVDSGNLAGYLWTLSAACSELRRAPIASAEPWRAIADALCLAGRRDEHHGKLNAAFGERLRAVERSISKDRANRGDGLFHYWEKLVSARDAIHTLRQDPVVLPQQTRYWLLEAERAAAAWQGQVLALAPFLSDFGRGNTQPHNDRVPAVWQEWSARLSEAQSVEQLANVQAELEAEAGKLSAAGRTSTSRAEDVAQLALLQVAFQRGQQACSDLLDQLEQVAFRCSALADGMNFAFLFDPNRELFVTGYNVTSARLDTSYYDLLASEARLASLVAVAKGDVPLEHWFRLGRPRARVTSGRSLLSWSGSMFEYLMPLLVTRNSRQTLLHETMDAVVSRQRAYGSEHDIPWGISESAYNVMDLEMTYQYRAFGVPGLGLKAGLAEDLVVAPYATVLACLVDPAAAVKNMRTLVKEGLGGQYGFFEAKDYTPTRVPPGKRGVVVKAFMAHHLGMSLVALDNVLHDCPMVRRFHSDVRVKATELLLEERIPTTAPLLKVPDAAMVAPTYHAADLDAREHVQLRERGPVRAHLLGRRVISSLVTTHGCGSLTCNGLDINRFREDAALDAGGIYAYVRNLTDGKVWSTGYQPTRSTPDSYEAAFSIDRVEIHRRDGALETTTEIAPSAEHAAEVRRYTFTNHGKVACDVELTTYTELVLAPRSADLSHRAFSGMFIETEAATERGALLAHRRKRSLHEPEIWVAQVLTPDDESFGDVEFETSRAAFIGRDGSVELPAALMPSAGRLGSHVGPVLDPAFVLRRRARIAPGARLRISLTTLAAESREEIMRLVENYAAPQAIPRVFELAWADARVELRHLGITAVQAHRFQRLLSAVLFPQHELRAQVEASLLSNVGRSALWGRGISGDLPIMVLRLDFPEFAELCKEVVLAHEHFRINGIAVDLLILNEEPSGYLTPVQDLALGVVRSLHAEGRLDQHGGIFLRRADQIPDGERNLLLAAGRVVLCASRGSLSRQLKNAGRASQLGALVSASTRLAPKTGLAEVVTPSNRPELLFDNGIGGFEEDGREYRMLLGPGSRTPAPWSNVMANPQFGSLVTESGSTFTWSGNSQRHRLTPWGNDAVADASGELLYVRDDDTQAIWSATPQPLGGASAYSVAHGQGYSRFEHTRGELEHELTMFVAVNDPVRVQRLRIVNRGRRTRQLSLFAMVEWVLGNNRDTSRLSVLTSFDGRALSAVNPFSAFSSSVAFLTTTARVQSFTGDREEFYGRPGSRKAPAGLLKPALSGKAGAGLDPCAALQTSHSIAPGDALEVSFILGQAADADQLKGLLAKYRDASSVNRALDDVRTFWDDLLKTVTIQTPDAALNLLFNRWLPYQALSCRIWARSGFYQSSGAFGFRDQIQDVLCLLHALPRVAREHIVRAAGRQFAEGDVQHWWHPEAGDGVRTHCSDDMLWLPYAVSEYLRVTGDSSILNEQVPFLSERALAPGEDDLYTTPSISADSASLYEHCARALDVSLQVGSHGLPKIGAGDWNDGMNRLGQEGKGESVWLGWFLSKALRDFAPIAQLRGDVQRAERWRSHAQDVTRAIDSEAWDGAWYRRAYFDDGTPLGTSGATECRIDAIAQSWATIAGGGDPGRASRALTESMTLLLDREAEIMLLLTPPFASSQPDPGYIASYPAGVRENGGQYTHGVLFTLKALAQSGDRAGVADLLRALNPVLHGDSSEKIERYKVEPYVVAADVYASPSHFGRGGWTWYTGAAGWFYRVILEDILGLKRHVDRIGFQPCVPPDWESFQVTYRFGRSVLHISVDVGSNADGAMPRLVMDGSVMRDMSIPLRDDGRKHEVHIQLAERKLRTSA